MSETRSDLDLWGSDRRDAAALNIRDAVQELQANGDKWEENARKSWRREDAANERWLQATKDLAEAKAKLETMEWQLRLLGDQRDHVLRWCGEREAKGTVRIWDLYSILMYDPKDGVFGDH